MYVSTRSETGEYNKNKTKQDMAVLGRCRSPNLSISIPFYSNETVGGYGWIEHRIVSVGLTLGPW